MDFHRLDSSVAVEAVVVVDVAVEDVVEAVEEVETTCPTCGFVPES